MPKTMTFVSQFSVTLDTVPGGDNRIAILPVSGYC